MKKLFFTLAVLVSLTVASCGGTNYNSKKIEALMEKIDEGKGEFTKSDVDELLEQYKAVCKQFYDLELKRDEGKLSDKEENQYQELDHKKYEIYQALWDAGDKLNDGTIERTKAIENLEKAKYKEAISK